MSSYTDTMLKLERMTQSTNAQQMAWQEKMTKSSHQMEVADLVAAGLNPVLSSGGSGAQSYTTSLESGANAIANTYAAKESAGATRYAARQSAAATRAAAYANLEAARLGYNASVYHSDKAFEAQKYTANMNYKTAIDKPVSSIGGAIDKFAQKSGLYDILGTKTVKGAVSNAIKLFDNPLQYFKNDVQKYGKITANNYALSSKGIQTVNNSLSKLGIKQNKTTRDLFIKAFVFGNSKAQRLLIGYIPRRSINSSSRLRMVQ